MLVKRVLLGPAYAEIHRILASKGSLDPREVPEAVFNALDRYRPNAVRTLAAAAYYAKARLAYRARRALSIAAHYDLPAAFYRLYLDDVYTAYSCAVFEDDARTLEAAQRRKFERMIARLDVKPGHRILEVGCGWGSFLKFARETGLEAEGVALSQAQVEECRRYGFRVHYADAAEGVPAPVDRVITLGMLEHAKDQRSRILANCFRALVPGGRMVVEEMCDGSEPGNLPAAVFVAEECFPGDRLGTFSSIQHAARQAGFSVAHLEALGGHYRATSLEWARRLAERFDEAEQLVGYRAAMTHLLCQAGFAWYFEVGAIDVLHYVLVKPG